MPTFVLIGHCGPDSFMMKSAVQRAVAGAKIVAADDHASLADHLKPDAVLLVNRVLDGGFDTDSGIELIRALAQSPSPPVMMLVSNLSEAQEQAQAAGARPGFGKREINAARTRELLRDAAGVNGA
jgi:hypothetical protein